LEDYGRNVENLQQARKLAEADPQVLGFAVAHQFGYFFKKVGTGFHPRKHWRSDAPATENWEFHYIVERVPKVKVLFLPAPMRGHAVPLMRMAEWFAKRDDFEAHVWLGGKFLALAPEGAVVHDSCGAQSMDLWAAAMAEAFALVTDCKDWYTSMARMISACMEDADRARLFGDVSVGAAQVVKEVSPDLVIADSMFGSDGAIPGLCSRHSSASFVQLSCPGQPGAGGWAYLWMIVSNLKEFGKLGDASKENDKRLLAETGPKMEKPHNWPHILPSCAALVRKEPSALEVCVGPFLPLPKAVDGAGSRQRPTLPEGPGSGLSADLRAWLLQGDSSEPIVYVAFGTLVRLGEDLALRLADGLQAGPWRVLWALPDAQQSALPERLRASSPRWRLEAFVPQAEVLSFARVRAFVSHCGQNSTQEALSFGVPMVCMPFYCDQFEWTETVVDARRAGVELDKLSATPGQVKDAVSKVLTDEKIRANALACAEAMAAECRALARPAQAEGEEELEEGGLAGLPAAAQVACEALAGTWQPRPPKPLTEQVGACVTSLAGSVSDCACSAAKTSTDAVSWMGSKLLGLLPAQGG